MAKIPDVHTRKRVFSGGIVYYAYYFEGPLVDGKRNQISKCGYSSEKEARSEGIKARDALYMTGVSIQRDKGDMSVADFIKNVWFPAKCKSKNWTENTVKGYEKIVRAQINPVIGKYPIRGVTIEMLQTLLDEMYDEKGYSHNSVSNLHGILCNIFRYAIEHNYVSKIYLNDFVVPKRDEDLEYERENHRYQVRDVIPETALDGIFERFDENSSAFIPMMISLFTGARLGEVFGLSWEDIDFENNMISIERQMQDDKVFYVCNPKYNSKRKVPLCLTLKEILLNEKVRQEENKKKAGPMYLHTYLVRRANTDSFKNKHGIYDIYCDNGDDVAREIHFINVFSDGKFKTPSVMKHPSRIIHGYSSNLKSPKHKKKGTPIFNDFNMHSFRHTFASSLNAQDMDPMLLSALLGHKKKAKEGMADVTTTYIHLDDEYIKRAESYINKIYTPTWKRVE